MLGDPFTGEAVTSAAGAVFEEHQGIETPQSDGIKRVDEKERVEENLLCCNGVRPHRTALN
ncbi:hypothetical protein JOF56_009809 [Kibdelosporangium banguiense]|uniref:Uncharacterized protein n=1 Tax=Kibdelosporangium banguiense TaxID=1365924 RepID=A0ABS4TZM9_9PSEU|nr:hypothetical protein [Kibdelosporangium banguiense]MBP2329424.1 hypothetical protein [Kibdelosporangium banguiense]